MKKQISNLLIKKSESGKMNKNLHVPVKITYKCKQCKQHAIRPEITKENWIYETWHDCANNVWKKEEKPQSVKEAA